MAPKYKLTYFELTGLGEPIRLLLHYGGIDFIDNRISQKDWPAIKPTTPLGQLPILDVDGKQLIQSTAIARFVAKQVGLAGDNDLEAYEIDAAVETANDLRLGNRLFVIAIAQYAFEADPKRKKELKVVLDKQKLPLLLSNMDSWAKSNRGYLANGKLSWADFYFFVISSFLPALYGGNFIEGYPNLQMVNKNVLAIPAVKAWIAKRPPDNFTF